MSGVGFMVDRWWMRKREKMRREVFGLYIFRSDASFSTKKIQNSIYDNRCISCIRLVENSFINLHFFFWNWWYQIRSMDRNTIKNFHITAYSSQKKNRIKSPRNLLRDERCDVEGNELVAVRFDKQIYWKQ